MVSFAGLFGAALAGLYEDATLHRRASTAYDAGGAITAGAPGSYPCKAAPSGEEGTPAMLEQMSTNGYAAASQRFFILAATLATVPTTDDELEFGGRRWAISTVAQDPGHTYWQISTRRHG